jgi:hypothetical protein
LHCTMPRLYEAPNVAQASLDLFIAAAGSKWGLRCFFYTGRMESLHDKALAAVPHAARACSALSRYPGSPKPQVAPQVHCLVLQGCRHGFREASAPRARGARWLKRSALYPMQLEAVAASLDEHDARGYSAGGAA